MPLSSSAAVGAIETVGGLQYIHRGSGVWDIVANNGGSVDLSAYRTASAQDMATANAIAGKANITDVNTALATKADASALAAKANTADIPGTSWAWTQRHTWALGTITTSQPLAVSQTWNASGVTFAAMTIDVTDTASASGSLIADFRSGGVSRFSIGKSGDVTANLALTVGSTGEVRINSRVRMGGPSDGVLLLRNAANSDFGRLQFGGTTNAFPAIRRTGTELEARLADDSGFGTYTGNIKFPDGTSMSTAAPTTKAAASDFRAGTDDTKYLTTLTAYAAAAEVAVSDSATITLNMATGTNFRTTLAGNRNLANPTSPPVGKQGRVALQQDATGGRTLSFGQAWKSASGTVPSLSPGSTFAISSISNAAPGVVTTSSAHGLVVSAAVSFTTTGSLPTGLAAGTLYFVVATPTATTFQVSATRGGSAIATSSAGSGTHTGRICPCDYIYYDVVAADLIIYSINRDIR